MIGRVRCLVLAGVLFVPLAARSQGLNTSAIDQALGRSGQKAGEVYRVGFPRTDLHVSVQGTSVPYRYQVGNGNDQNTLNAGRCRARGSNIRSDACARRGTFLRSLTPRPTKSSADIQLGNARGTTAWRLTRSTTARSFPVKGTS